MSIERSYPSGGWRISAVVDGYWESRLYLGYSKRQAVALFKSEVGA